jgi:frataxin-like iron-binding protein CyaY
MDNQTRSTMIINRTAEILAMQLATVTGGKNYQEIQGRAFAQAESEWITNHPDYKE